MANALFDGLFGEITPSRRFALLEDSREYTYQHVMDVSAKFANVLVAAGVEPGDRVAVQVPKSIEALMLYFGTVRAGGVFLPLNTAYTPQEVDYFLENASPRIFVCAPEQESDYREIADERSITLETLGVWKNPETSAGTLSDKALEADTNFATVTRSSDDLAAILYTSGTTGRSKGAMMSHGNLLSNAQTLADCWRFTPEDVLLHALPIFHTHGLFVACNVIAISGGSMIFLPGFDMDKVLKFLPESTSMMGVPTFYTRLLDEKRFTRELVQNFRLFVSGSAPLLAETHIAFEKRTGHRILERYGMTETNMNISNPYDGERKAGTVGLPLPGIEVRIVDPESRMPVNPGEIGSIEVRGPNVFKGYWQMPEKTKEELHEDGFLTTGDLGQVDESGYIKIVGRSKDLIISGGYNIYPKEIELILDEQDGVLESAVIGVPHPDFGEGVVGVLVAIPGQKIQEDEIMASLQGKIARFKQPKRLVVVDELPRNTMGKVQKNILRDNYTDSFAD